MQSFTEELDSLVQTDNSIIFIMSVRHSSVPTSWRRSFVTPVYKSKGAISGVKNHRPIAISVVASQVIEKIIADRLMEHCERNSLLGPRQFGSRGGRSIILQLIVAKSEWITDHIGVLQPGLM